MDCIIIDDESTARLIINQLCSKVSSLKVVGEFSNAMQAIKYLNQNEVDLIFLDIHMPDFTGFDFIETLKNPPKIILTTSDANFAIQAFEYDCIVDYLVKPITPERFQKAIQKAFAETRASLIANQTVKEKTKYELIQVNALKAQLKLATLRYDNGYSSYLEVLDAQRSLFNTQLSLIEAQRNQIKARVEFIKAIGGGWERPLLI